MKTLLTIATIVTLSFSTAHAAQGTKSQLMMEAGTWNQIKLSGTGRVVNCRAMGNKGRGQCVVNKYVAGGKVKVHTLSCDLRKPASKACSLKNKVTKTY